MRLGKRTGGRIGVEGEGNEGISVSASRRDDTNRRSREIHSGQYVYSHSIWASVSTNAFSK